MKKQFLAILSAVAVAGTVITAPLVSSQADEENEEIFTTEGKTYGELQSLINDGIIEQLGTHGGPNADNGARPEGGPCISAHGDWNDFGGIKIKLADANAGDVLSAEFQLKATGTGDVKVYLKQGDTETVMLKHSAYDNWTEYQTTSTATVKDSEDVYLCIAQLSGLFYVADIKVYKTSGGVSTEQPSEQASAEPTNAPTAAPSEGDWQKVLDHTNALDGNEDNKNMYKKYSSNSDVSYNQWGPDNTPCIEIKGGSDQNPSGIKIDVSKLFRAGDRIRAEFKIQVTGYPDTIKAFVTDGDTNTSEMKYCGEVSPSERVWIDYKTSPTEVKSENGNVYFCVTNESGWWDIMDLVLYKQSGETEPDKPTATPAPTDTPTPTEVPTKKPELKCERAKFIVDGSLGDVIAGATLEDDEYVIKSTDGEVVSAWKCVFTGAAPGGLDVTATSGGKSGEAYVGETDTTIDGTVTFYVLVNSDSSDIEFKATVHHVE